MDIVNFVSDHWHIMLFIIGLVFTIGKIMQKMTTYTTKDDVHKAVKDEVTKQFTNHCPFADKLKEFDEAHLEKFINRRIELHPILQKYNVTQYRIEQLEPDVKEIKNDIQTIKLALAKLEEK